MIPIGTNYRLRSTPWVNYALVATNVFAFIFLQGAASQAGMGRINDWMLWPARPQLFQFFTSVFLHGGWMHLIGNMIFLWVFGNAINDRLGHAGYLAFYLAGGILAGIGYMLLSSGNIPVLGASGAISAVTGAYLVLLPRTRITVLIPLLYVLMPLELSGLVFLLFQFVWNMWMSLDARMTGASAGGVAYAAHSAGYIFGIVIAAVLLAARLLPRDPFDLLNLVRGWHRRSRYQRMAARGYDPFSGVSPGIRQPPASGRRVEATPVETVAVDSPAARELELRSEISQSCARNDLQTAADKYLQLVQISEEAILPRRQQLDVANQLMSSERHPAAADAYERFCKHYGNYEHIADIYLMLGLLYGRYVHRYDQAEHYLTRAIDRLSDPRKLQMARGELEKVRSQRRE